MVEVKVVVVNNSSSSCSGGSSSCSSRVGMTFGNEIKVYVLNTHQ